MANEPLRVIVTAGGAGIGYAIARGFSEAGHNVHVCDIQATALEATTCSLPSVKASVADVADTRQVDLLFREALAWLGGLDVLINNAGVGGPRAPLEDVDDADWEHCLRVNLTGSFFTMKRAVPIMKGQGSGCIINIATSSARTGLPNRSPYVVSKVGLMGLTKNAARELGPWNIRCNAILPGVIDNDRGRALITSFARTHDLTTEEGEKRFLSYISMRTMIDPAEVAEAALFLAGAGGRHISGQMLGVCGNAEWEA